MAITLKDIDEATANHKAALGGTKNSYFALLYLGREFDRLPDLAARHIAFTKDTEEGINAFHADTNRRTLYLFSFQWSPRTQDLKAPLKLLAHEGIERIFGPQPADASAFLTELRDRLNEDQAAIDKVIVQFVFNGDPLEADQSGVLDSLREDLDAKKHLIDRFFDGRNIPLTFQFISNATRAPRVTGRMQTTHRYEFAIDRVITTSTESGEQLHIGLIRAVDLYRMFKEMGQRLFQRNIRAGLDPDGPINRRIRTAFLDIVEGRASGSAFAFNHNGITMAAEEFEIEGTVAHVTEPRVLNGAQTITSLARFLDQRPIADADGNEAAHLDSVKMLAKIVTKAAQPFVTTVTINTNRQNPVEPANLRASDEIQLELQDKFKNELDGIIYERQENLFASLSDEEKEDLGFDPSHTRAIELKRLARTLLASQGEIDRMSRLNDMFETESQYQACFASRILRTDARRIVLAYKIQPRLHKIARAIEAEAASAWYVRRSTNLLWALLVQGVLNHRKLNDWLEAYGTGLRNEPEFTEELVRLGTSKVRQVIREVVAEPRHQAQLEQKQLSFLRTKAIYLRCMEVAELRHNWTKMSL